MENITPNILQFCKNLRGAGRGGGNMKDPGIKLVGHEQ